MRVHPIDGAWYVDALPTGEFAAALFEGKKVITHEGVIETGRDLLFIRCGKRGGQFHFAGQDQAGEGNFEDLTHVGDSFGVNPVIYLQDGTLKQVPVGESHQGYRFVRDDGRIMTGDETLPLEWTEFDGVRVRQGQEGGCLVELDGSTRVLHEGDAFFIRVQHQGELFSVAFWQLRPLQALVYWLTKDEMRGLPLVATAPKPAPKPAPQPEVPPVPTSPMIPDSEINRAKAEIAAHPLGENQPDGPWVNARAAALGGRWGLNGKRGDPHNLSHDILAYRISDDPSVQPILVDVLGDGGGANVETFQILEWPQASGAIWIAPQNDQEGPQEPPGQLPGPAPLPTPSVDLGKLLEALQGLQERFGRNDEKLVQMNAAVEELIQDVAGIRAVLRQPISTSRDAFHSHHVTILQEKK